MKYAHTQDDFSITTSIPLLSPVSIARRDGSWVLTVVKDSQWGLSYIREMVRLKTELTITVVLSPNGKSETLVILGRVYEYEFQLGGNELNLVHIYLHEITN